MLKAERSDDFPLDVSPITQIMGNLMYFFTCVVDVTSSMNSRKSALPANEIGKSEDMITMLGVEMRS